jgi:hypothetical protein
MRTLGRLSGPLRFGATLFLLVSLAVGTVRALEHSSRDGVVGVLIYAAVMLGFFYLWLLVPYRRKRELNRKITAQAADEQLGHQVDQLVDEHEAHRVLFELHDRRRAGPT